MVRIPEFGMGSVAATHLGGLHDGSALLGACMEIEVKGLVRGMACQGLRTHGGSHVKGS